MSQDWGDPRLLDTNIPHDHEEMIDHLVQYLKAYARKDNWILERCGEPPNFLRRNMWLNFYPSNVVNGYVFAEEALEKVKKFNEQQGVIREVTEECVQKERNLVTVTVGILGFVIGVVTGACALAFVYW